MSIVEFNGGRITHKYLMGKTKWELARLYMELLGSYEELEEKYRDLLVRTAGIVPGALPLCVQPAEAEPDQHTQITVHGYDKDGNYVSETRTCVGLEPTPLKKIIKLGGPNHDKK